jgi:subtilisin family serine protease
MAKAASRDRKQTAQNRIVYVHGCGPQLRPSELKREWDESLFGHTIGELSKVANWRRRLPGSRESAPEQTAEVYAGKALREIVFDAIHRLSRDADQEQVLKGVVSRIEREGKQVAKRAQISASGESYYTRRVAVWLASDFLPDLHAYLFDASEQEFRELQVVDRLSIPQQRFVVIAHEVGALVAYGALHRLDQEGLKVDVTRLITTGSPLGMKVIREAIAPDTKQLTVPRCVRRWINIGNGLDPVGYYPVDSKNVFANVTDVELDTEDVEFDLPQSPAGYLESKEVRNEVRNQDVFGVEFGQVVSDFRVAKDVVRLVEDAAAEQRHEVLVEYADIDDHGRSISKRDILAESVRKISGNALHDTRVEYFDRFAAAYLTRAEIEQLSSELELNIKIWRDSKKSSLLFESIHTVQAFTAQRGYDAVGRGIGWAVLDTGVDGGHPHFNHEDYRTIAGQWDCTKPLSDGEPVQALRNANTDVDGHGTHVSAVIAGRYNVALPFETDPDGPRYSFAGVAPETKIYSFKVLKDNGVGRDSFIIKALDHIARLNERANTMQIHGVNLSLGGSFEPEVYGCGHSPICRELRRLWNQGVLVCIAAGNEGLMTVTSGRRESTINRDLSINDPANLDEAIAVGSIHKNNPFTYGVSHFSSRGPTADGRIKPDLVAPGERIYSAKAGAQASEAVFIEDLYVELSGTSMAAPHVSGILAAFLSRRREFIGYPDKTKQILLRNCESLGRDPYFQGHGMPNTVNMLLHTQLTE